MDNLFSPNDLTPEQIPNLEDWQLLIAAVHFAPEMNDCVEIGYKYSFDGESIHCHNDDGVKICSLQNEVDIEDAQNIMIEKYFGDWRKVASQNLFESTGGIANG